MQEFRFFGTGRQSALAEPRTACRTSSAKLLCLNVGIRIVADCVPISCQVTRKLKRAKTLEYNTASAIIFIHCCKQLFLYHIVILNYMALWSRLIFLNSLMIKNGSFFEHPKFFTNLFDVYIHNI